MWRGCLTETLDEYERGHGVDPDQLRPFLRDGFPWHRPEVAHPELCEPERWWQHVEALLSAAYEGVGIKAKRARELASLARERYIDASQSWRLFDDTKPTLESLKEIGWRHAIFSNHVPELPALVEGLGLSHLIDVVLTSAATGYEKPNRRAFELALRACGRPRDVWMVGDNPVADIAGAEAVGIPAVLVRSTDNHHARTLRDLNGLSLIVAART
jgi:putative hydrolase of the HAD superfamily